ncbi:MAG: RagB/SusD family nutrient uptake outer membrane protein [Prevotella sp.]|nr:RagB/SusD family nutrient uptake outer membrane protein [Prevotella sp.]
MKKKYLYIAIAAVSILFTMNSCSLEEVNPSAISTSQEWSTAAGYEKLINGCYFDLVRIVYGQAEDTYVIASEGGTDIWQDVRGGSNGNWSKALIYSNDFGANTYMFQEAYSGFYGCLSQCNAAIDYADKVTGLKEAEKNALVAEAHFIRAHCLYSIVEYWGGKYLPTSPTTSAITELPLSTVNEFYDVILADLDFAKQNLPVSQSVRGHVTRAAAYHLYAKAALTYATYTDGLGNCEAISEAQSRELLNKAKESADYLINNASSLGVKLYSDIEDVFDEKLNKTNEEALFIITHSTIQSLNPRGNYYNRAWKHWDSYNNASDGIGLAGITPTYNVVKTVNGDDYRLAKGNCYMTPSKYMFDLYGEKDGRYKAFFIDTWYINKPNDGDAYKWTAADATRFGLDASRVNNPSYNIQKGDTAIYIARGKHLTKEQRNALRYGSYNLEDNFANPASPGKFFPTLKKNLCTNLFCGTNASKPYSAADCIIYRLGETYLLAAEISWRLGDNNTAAQRLNTIRNRACIGHDGSMNVTANEINANLLLDENAREMIGEWQRWQTLKRFRMLKERVALNPQITNWKDDYYFRPVMQSEIDLMDNGEEYQNPGY